MRSWAIGAGLHQLASVRLLHIADLAYAPVFTLGRHDPSRGSGAWDWSLGVLRVGGGAPPSSLSARRRPGRTEPRGEHCRDHRAGRDHLRRRLVAVSSAGGTSRRCRWRIDAQLGAVERAGSLVLRPRAGAPPDATGYVRGCRLAHCGRLSRPQADGARYSLAQNLQRVEQSLDIIATGSHRHRGDLRCARRGCAIRWRRRRARGGERHTGCRARALAAGGSVRADARALGHVPGVRSTTKPASSASHFTCTACWRRQTPSSDARSLETVVVERGLAGRISSSRDQHGGTTQRPRHWARAAGHGRTGSRGRWAGDLAAMAILGRRRRHPPGPVVTEAATDRSRIVLVAVDIASRGHLDGHRPPADPGGRGWGAGDGEGRAIVEVSPTSSMDVRIPRLDGGVSRRRRSPATRRGRCAILVLTTFDRDRRPPTPSRLGPAASC